MARAFPWTRREVWTRKLLYPGHTLPTAAAPIIVAIGLAWHDRVFAPVPIFLAFIAGWLIQFAGVVTDNYSNLLRQPDDREHPELVEAIKTGILSLDELRTTILASYGLAAFFGLVLFVLAGWPVIVIGLLSILASWAYSAGPWPFGRHGFADPLFFLFFGIVSVFGAYFVQAADVLGREHWREGLSLTAVAVSLPIGALITNILIIYSRHRIRCDQREEHHRSTIWTILQPLRIHHSDGLCVSFTILDLAGPRIQRLGPAYACDVAAGNHDHTRGLDARPLRRSGPDDAAPRDADGRLFDLSRAWTCWLKTGH
jgi:1,4-dihydroxy-2-naphthoate polyprenyltransferase